MIKNKLPLVTAGLAALFLALWFAVSLHVLSWTTSANKWVMGDWLLHWEAGFARRGSPGTAFIGVHDLTGAPLHLQVGLTLFLLYTAFFALCFWLIWQRQLSLWHVLLILGPAGLLFPILDGSGGGRKELIHFVLLACWCMFLSQLRTVTWAPIAAMSVGVAASVTAHEMFVFLSILYAAALYVRVRQLGGRASIPQLVAIPAAACAAGALILAFGLSQSVTTQALCAPLLDRGLPAHICAGALAWPSGLSVNLTRVWDLAADLDYAGLYAAPFLLSAAPTFGIWAVARQNGHDHARIVILAAAAAIAPLFVIALDWGRWIHIYVVSVFVILASFAARKPLAIEPAALARPKRAFGAGLILGLYVTTWSLPHCCSAGNARSVMSVLVRALPDGAVN